MKKISLLGSLLLLFSSCGPQFMMGMRDQSETDYVIAELRSEIVDLKQQTKHHEMEFQLLDEKLDKVSVSKTTDVSHKINDAKLERRVAELERALVKMKEELKELVSYANQSNSSLMQAREKLLSCEKQITHQSDVLNEVAKLKGTLSSLSKAMQEPSSSKTYKVRSGDSLEKIARQHNSTIDLIKKVNGLNSDTIMIGQELKIPHDTK
ncbi:MAG TPA: LysM peptidoglycan-binding domain-containing protein [Rhabdochlamydiaceae bacterium]|nr:LysM peptidoglycan-binding domain-containing protein [Rhabdochlamydiaceae bacterium]